ncbi:sugar transferase [candidate division KSB1 bacterium]|nr:sugar transferase [candidate division KSB1 bacterium]
MSPSIRIFKRAFVLVIALVGIILTLPLYPILGLLIKLESKGPVIYRQKRVGLVTRDTIHYFYMLKFRSMYQDAEARGGPQWATDADPRITRMGKFLRKTRLDELPQMFKVLKGEMSIIGPRPERPHFVEKLDQSIPFYFERVIEVKPGITGLAQIHCAYDTSIESVKEKLYYDHAYAARLTSFKEFILTDLSIIFDTIAVMIKGKGAK